jgi:hypothetical protein
MEMKKDPEEEYEPDGTGTYEGEDTVIIYDVDQEQHVEVKEK